MPKSMFCTLRNTKRYKAQLLPFGPALDLGVPKSSPGFGDLLGGLIGLSMQSYSWLRFIPAKGYKQNQQREKAHGMKSRGYQMQASKSSLPVESLRICLIPPASNCGDTCEMSTRETHEKLSPQSFSWELITWQPLPSMYQNFGLPERKQVFSINRMVCTTVQSQ